MLLVGAYPRSVLDEESTLSPLTLTRLTIDRLLPSWVTLHLLPFYPSDGDFGFAPKDWFAVDTSFGSWADIEQVCRFRPVVVDGIYNHVGLSHAYMKSLRQGLQDFQSEAVWFRRPGDISSNISIPRSPRGGSVLRPHKINGIDYYLWQTFSDAAVDLDLNHEIVRIDIDRQMALLRTIGATGLRLDAPAYYSKFLEETHRHHAESYRLSSEIARMAIHRGFRLIAQLDCDEHGLAYFNDLADIATEITIVDYSYTAHLVLAIVSGNPNFLVDHVSRTTHLPRRILRPIRTHDGVLLRSKIFPHQAKLQLIKLLHHMGLNPRVIDGSPYEYNSSLPRLLRGDESTSLMLDKLELAIAFTCMIPGTPYLYLPAILAFEPESSREAHLDSDPRGVNRKPIDSRYLRTHASSEWVMRVRNLISRLQGVVNEGYSLWGAEYSVRALREGVLECFWGSGSHIALFNFSRSEQPVDTRGQNEIIAARGFYSNNLKPYGFVVSKKTA